MKKALSRLLSSALVLALCAGLLLVPVSAEGVSLSADAGQAAFTLTGEEIAVGKELTVTASGLDVEDGWSFNIHLSKDGADRYSIVDADGKQSAFVSLNDAFSTLMDTIQASVIQGDGARTFTLTIPEEYQDWSAAVRISCGQSFYEIPLPLSSGTGAEPEPVSFDDVAESAWYYRYVTAICQDGWMSGKGSGFDPEGQLTIAEVLTLAARLHSAQSGADIAAADGAWYMAYYNYCLANGIIAQDQFAAADMDRAATRFEMVSVLDKAVHESRTNGLVNPGLANGFIPDLDEDGAYGEVVYRWFRSGLLSGDAQHNFNGATNIKRSEVSVILCQLLYLVDRVTF